MSIFNRPAPGDRPNLFCHVDPSVVGTLLAYGSAVGYTAANICLRALTHCDPSWVSAVKAFLTFALVGPWLLLRALRSQTLAPSLKALGLLMLAGLVGQLGGNVLFQWSLGVVGIALCVPLTLGAMIITGALLGQRFLGEYVSRRMILAMAVLIVSILILGCGAAEANRSISGADVELVPWSRLLYVAAGVAAACASGASYGLLGLAIRHAANGGMPVSTILASVTSVGVVALGALSYWKIGLDAMLNTPAQDLSIMLLAGVCNAIAFWSLTRALQLVSLVYTNALNASQAAMAAVAGIAFFHEAPTLAMAVGIALTIVGLLLMKNERRGDKATDSQHTADQLDDVSPRETTMAIPADGRAK